MNDQVTENDSAEAVSQRALPLFYSNPVPLLKERHGNKRVLPQNSAAFAGKTNAIPINLVEFAPVSRHYPIAFVSGETPFPVAVVGLRDGENLFVDSDGQWEKGCYIPAYVRRYPFILISANDGDTLTLGIDEQDNVLSEEEGAPIFEQSGDPSEQTKAAREFCRAYSNASEPTKAFTKALVEKDLLIERQANVVNKAGDRFNLSGFNMIDLEKAQHLDAKTIGEWWKAGWAQGITAHQIAAQNWASLAERS